MFKYIVKRLLISILILLGVSIIIYTMVRLMPNDYIDSKYSSQLQNGTIKQEDVDNFKKLYGLYSPEAQMRIQLDKSVVDSDYHEAFGKGVFQRDVKELDYQNGIYNDLSFMDFVAGTYRNGQFKLVLSYDKDTEKGTFVLSRIDKKTVTEQNADGEMVEVEVDSPVELFKGSYVATVEGLSVAMTKNGGVALDVSTQYHVTTFWEKLGTILGGYFTWLGNVAKGDMGISFTYNKPVAQVIGENMWISFAIALVATALQFVIAIPLGISSATHQYSVQDYLVTIFTMMGLSLPTYFFAYIVIKFLSVDLGLFPSNGLIYASANYPETFAGFFAKFGDILHHLVLPIFVSVILSIGGLMRYTRTNMLEVLNMDYIRTARAKGLSEKKVIYKHAFRNTMIPLATLLAGILPSLFGGMMITEEVFGIDGIGRLAYNALMNGDVPFVMGYNMFLAILTVIGTLFSDIMYSLVDPRVSLGK